MRLVLLLASALAATGCTTFGQQTGLIPRWAAAWKDEATAEDNIRLRDWRLAFIAGLDAAKRAGHASEIAREGALLDPDAAEGGGGPIPNGPYRCRVIKLGAREPGNLDYIAYPAVPCAVSPQHNLQQLTTLGGLQRYAGLLFPGDPVRQVFLGTLVLGDETRPLQYGQDQTRDVAGYVERIGPSRWRLIMPKPHFESQLDVMELIPLTERVR